MGLLLFLVACLVTYGSLYPFEFSQAGVNQTSIDAFLTSWNAHSSRGDILGNLALFIPFGLFGLLALPPRSSRLIRFLLLAFLGFVLAVGVQILQLYIPARSPALVDVIWNMVGLTLGAMLVSSARAQSVIMDSRLGATVFIPLILLGCWIASLLVPFVPSIDFQLWKNSLKPLLLTPSFDTASFARDFSAWLAAACLGAWIVGERRLPLKFAAVVLLTLGLKIVVVKNYLTLTDVTAGIAAIAIFSLLIERLPRRELVVALLLLAGHFYAGLTPLEARSGVTVFAWIPFQGSLSGSMFINASIIAYKAFFYGALIWLLARDGIGHVRGTIIAVLAAGLVEIGQLYIGHGSPEITDLLLALVAGLVIFAFRDNKKAAATVPQETQPVRTEPDPAPTPPAQPEKVGEGWLRVGLTLAISVAVLSGGVYAIRLLPGIPYNVQELLSIEAPQLVIFSAALIWICFGGALAGWITASSRWQPMILPLLCIVSGVISFYLLDESVPDESLFDIVGTPTIYRDIVGSGLWGSWGQMLVGLIKSQAAFRELEILFRFLALYGLFALPFAALVAAFRRLDAYPDIIGRQRAVLFSLAAAIYLAMAAPWIVLGKYVAFNFANTDNIVELIAPVFGFQFGGAWILIALFIMVTTVGAFIGWRHPRPSVKQTIIKWSIALASLPLGFILANFAFENSVQKYGQTFHALDFILGANRGANLSTLSLMLRWSLLQSGWLLIIMLGIFMLPSRHSVAKETAGNSMTEVRHRPRALFPEAIHQPKN